MAETTQPCLAGLALNPENTDHRGGQCRRWINPESFSALIPGETVSVQLGRTARHTDLGKRRCLCLRVTQSGHQGVVEPAQFEALNLCGNTSTHFISCLSEFPNATVSSFNLTTTDSYKIVMGI